MRAIMTVCILLTTTTVAWAGDGSNSAIPWSTAITLVLVLLTAIAGGLVASFRRALKASYEAMKVLSDALDDGSIDDTEIKMIVKQAVEFEESWKDVIEQVGKLFKKAHKV